MLATDIAGSKATETAAQEGDELGKPDMEAVLSRTHLALNLHDFLLPTFEAVSNAMHAIESLHHEKASAAGHIRIRFLNPTDPLKLKVTITDNGVGLNEENYKSFKTPFSGFKLKQHGRGFGRFIAFKVFGRTVYRSRYSFFTDKKIRSFQFDLAREKEFVFLTIDPDFEHTGVCVEYDHPLTPWHELIRNLNLDEVADAIGSHFLPYFLYRWLPSISIQFDDEEPQDITTRFRAVFVESGSGNIMSEIEGNGETLHYSITKIPKTKTFKNHCLLFSAADRIVGSPRDLSNKLGQPHFEDESGKRYIVIAIVRGAAFESRLNDSRTGLNLPVKDIEGIVSKVSDVIQASEISQISKIKDNQSTDLDSALRENPILRASCIILRARGFSAFFVGSARSGLRLAPALGWRYGLFDLRRGRGCRT